MAVLAPSFSVGAEGVVVASCSVIFRVGCHRRKVYHGSRLEIRYSCTLRHQKHVTKPYTNVDAIRAHLDSQHTPDYIFVGLGALAFGRDFSVRCGFAVGLAAAAPSRVCCLRVSR